MNEETTHTVWVAQISFYAPESAPINVIAQTKEEAMEIIPRMLPNCKDIVIHTLVEQSAIKRPKTATPMDEPPMAPASEAVH